MKNRGSFTSNFLVLFSGNTISQIVPFLFQPVIGRLFLEEEIAIKGNFLALVGLVSIVAGARYETAIVLPADKKKAMNLFAIASWFTVAISVLSILFYVFRENIDSFYKEGGLSEYLILMVIAVPLFSFNNIFRQWLIREKKFRSLTSSGIALSTFSNLFCMMFGYAGYGILGLLLGTLIGYLISLVMMYIASRNTLDLALLDKSSQRSLLNEYKDFPLINAPHAFMDLFAQVILFAIITREFGLKEFGCFFMMSSLLLGSMRAIGSAVGQLYYKEASDLYSADGNVSVALIRSIKIVAIFAIPASVVIFFFGPEIFGWYLSGKYTRSGELAQIMIIPIFINFIVSPISATPIIYRKQGSAFVFSLIGYSTGIGAILIGNYLEFDFFHTLIVYAITQAVYYLWLLTWYIHLTRYRV